MGDQKLPEPAFSADYRVEIDAFMLYIGDAEREADMTEVWMSYRKDDRIGCMDGFAILGTVRCGEVHVSVRIFDESPVASGAYSTGDHITQCNVSFPSGSVSVSGSLTELHDGSSCFEVTPGAVYTMRAVHTGLRSIAMDRLSGDDHYTVVLWPAGSGAAGEGVEVLTRFDPFASVEVFPQLTATELAAMGLAATIDEGETEEEDEPLYTGEFQVDVDAFMLVVADAGEAPDLQQIWLTFKREQRIGCGAQGTFAVVGMARCGPAYVTVGVYERMPAQDLAQPADADHITDCVVRFPSGGVMLSGSLAEIGEGSSCFGLTPDAPYVMRAIHKGLSTVTADKTGGEDVYTLLFWPDDGSSPPGVVLAFN